MLLEGIYLPVTTPFYPDERVYLKKVEHNVGRYSLTPASGLVICGPGAEAAGLTDAETAEVLRSAAGAAAKEKVLVAGVSRNSVFATLALAEVAREARYDAILVCPPSTSLMEPEVRIYFQMVADRSPLPLVLWSEPGREISAKLVVELADHSGVIGLIDGNASLERLGSIGKGTGNISREVTVTPVFAAATGRMLQVEEAGPGSFVSTKSLLGGGGLATAQPSPTLRTRTKQVGFQVLAGSTGAMLTAWEQGAVGAVPTLGACAPQSAYEVWQAWKDADLPLAAEKQERLRAAAQEMAGVGAVKYGCELNGYFGGRARLPAMGLTATERSAVEDVMSELRN